VDTPEQLVDLAARPQRRYPRGMSMARSLFVRHAA